jgi:SAM-dependent methyltransferase
MAAPADYCFRRYLAAKKTVDDRALNRRVWDALMEQVRLRRPASPLDVLEVGAGIGTMVERLVEWGLFARASEALDTVRLTAPHPTATVTAIDSQTENIAEARRRLPSWAAEQRFTVDGGVGGGLVLDRQGLRLTLDLEAVDLRDFAARNRGHRTWDLLIGQALLDVVDVPATLPDLVSLVEPGGLLYFTITFDGGTILQPEIDRALDDQIEALYHRTNVWGDCRAGRRLFHQLGEAGVETLDMGAADWVVFPGRDGYVADEAYFLHFIVHTIDTALRGHPGLDQERFDGWISQRHAQIERNELVYISNHLDALGRVAPERSNGSVKSTESTTPAAASPESAL